MTVPYTIHTGDEGDELVFAQVFQRPNQSITRPAIGVFLWEVEEGEFQVSLAFEGLIRGGTVWPEGLEHRMSEVVSLREAKKLMRTWIGEVEAALQAEWDE